MRQRPQMAALFAFPPLEPAVAADAEQYDAWPVAPRTRRRGVNKERGNDWGWTDHEFLPGRCHGEEPVRLREAQDSSATVLRTSFRSWACGRGGASPGD
jgi:hypothetical protein